MKNKNLLIIAVVLVVGFVFYWFQVRPSMIKKDCVRELEYKTVEVEPESEKPTSAYEKYQQETMTLDELVKKSAPPADYTPPVVTPDTTPKETRVVYKPVNFKSPTVEGEYKACLARHGL